MKSTVRKIKLTEKDKKTLSKHLNICTDTHGKGCDDLSALKSDKNLN